MEIVMARLDRAISSNTLALSDGPIKSGHDEAAVLNASGSHCLVLGR
jgi:hypothetical protein